MKAGLTQHDPDKVHREKYEAQEKQIAEYAERIKAMFQEHDKQRSGKIRREQLIKLFQKLDNAWSNEDMDEIVSLVAGSGAAEVKYGDFVDWFMDEDDPKFRKKMCEDMHHAFQLADDDDDEAEDEVDDQAALLENEDDLEDLNIDLDQKVTKSEWQVVHNKLEIDDEEGEDLWNEIADEMQDKGEDPNPSDGFPMREFLEEMKTNDRDGIEAFDKALKEAKSQIATEKRSKKPSVKLDNYGVPEKTMFNKVVFAIDKNNIKAEDAYEFANEGHVKLNHGEMRIFDGYADRQDEFVAKVKENDNSPPAVCASSGQTACKEHCILEVNEIIDEFRNSGKKFVDPEWNVLEDPCNVLYTDKQGPGYDCTVTTPAKWKRLPDIIKPAGAGKALGSLFGGFSAGKKPKAKPVLFKGGVKAGDIVQGQIGTCFFLGALGALAAHNEESVKKMFIKYDVDAGVYGVRFNLDGEWTYVIIDDYLPVDQDGLLLYASSKDPQEVWVPLLEKAYCKLHTCFEMCDGGMPNEAIAAMYGGVGDRFKISKAQRRDPKKYFKVLKQARQKGWIMSTGFLAGKHDGASAGKCGEAVLPTGLVAGHAYSVLRVVEAHGNMLVQCRNPWASGEWTGKWSDENEDGEWTDEMKEATGYTGLPDGKFWMDIHDFVSHSAGVDYARTFGTPWKKVTQYRHFQKTDMVAVATADFVGRRRNELSFSKGDKIEVHTFTGRSWTGMVKGSNKTGSFPPDMVQLKKRPVACFELNGTKNAGFETMRAVIVLMQPMAHRERRYIQVYGQNYKDTSYPNIQLLLVGPDGSLAIKREGKQRTLWGEVQIPGGRDWRIYVLSSEGDGDFYSLRCFLKDGTATLEEVPDVDISVVQDLM